MPNGTPRRTGSKRKSPESERKRTYPLPLCNPQSAIRNPHSHPCPILSHPVKLLWLYQTDERQQRFKVHPVSRLKLEHPESLSESPAWHGQWKLTELPGDRFDRFCHRALSKRRASPSRTDNRAVPGGNSELTFQGDGTRLTGFLAWSTARVSGCMLNLAVHARNALRRGYLGTLPG
jgi:hypothetical protein